MNRRRMLAQMGISTLAAANLTALQAFAETLPGSDALPGLFIGHGSPMNAIEENHFVRGFREIAQSIPKPKAILCISAHWFIDGTKVTAMNSPRTIYDFGGFPRELLRLCIQHLAVPILPILLSNSPSPHKSAWTVTGGSIMGHGL